MLRDYLTKRKTFRKTVKAAVKEEVKSSTRTGIIRKECRAA